MLIVQMQLVQVGGARLSPLGGLRVLRQHRWALSELEPQAFEPQSPRATLAQGAVARGPVAQRPVAQVR